MKKAILLAMVMFVSCFFTASFVLAEEDIVRRSKNNHAAIAMSGGAHFLRSVITGKDFSKGGKRVLTVSYVLDREPGGVFAYWEGKDGDHQLNVEQVSRDQEHNRYTYEFTMKMPDVANALPVYQIRYGSYSVLSGYPNEEIITVRDNILSFNSHEEKLTKGFSFSEENPSDRHAGSDGIEEVLILGFDKVKPELLKVIVIYNSGKEKPVAWWTPGDISESSSVCTEYKGVEKYKMDENGGSYIYLFTFDTSKIPHRFTVGIGSERHFTMDGQTMTRKLRGEMKTEKLDERKSYYLHKD